MPNVKYWDMFCKSGKIEQYLKYKSNFDLQAEGNRYVESEKPKIAKTAWDSD